MNNAHLHLVFNYLLIIFPIVGIIVLLIGIFTKSEVSKRNSYFIFILGAIASVAAMATGEGAEETVENIVGISENVIQTHEEAAELFAALSYVLGITSLLGMIVSFKNSPLSKFSHFVVLLMAFITLFFLKKQEIQVVKFVIPKSEKALPFKIRNKAKTKTKIRKTKPKKMKMRINC
jgi:hypothetical protein